MSLILEALRKSEAERRRGQVPGLHAELPPASRPARPRRAHWPWLAATAVIAVVAATWLLRNEWAPAPPADEPARVSTERATPAETDRVVADTPRADSTRPVDVALPATEPMGAAPSADIAAAAKPAPSTTAATPASTAPVMVPRQPPEPATTKAPSRDPAPGREPVPVAADSNPLPPPRPTTPATTPATAPPADATTTAPDDSALLHLSDLAAAERRALPPLQVSMHMWAPTSARRFAIIDGARVNEGDRLGDAVVDAITRDGVVLAWRGRRVHIPIH
ncbi:general secretion pathway protein GspB [Novilysobacter erysipheiresistens]|uniref:General secretion pathway protein GspB n=1 Tax=Novilysobacter erysipheiresistens TaxID=1749332 RepID=A0ABU7YX05_9GAMM